MNLFAVIIALVVIVVVFLICRELICWYWKINESVEMLTEMRTLMTRSVKTQERIVELLEASQASSKSSAPSDGAPGLPTMFPQN